MKSHPSLALPVLVLLGAVGAACAQDAAEPAPPGDEPPDPRIARLREHPATCGAAEYRWLDDASLGTIVEWEEANPSRLTADELRSILAGAGYTLGVELRFEVAIYRFRYRTQDRGQPAEATALLTLPLPGPGVPAALPLLEYLHGTSGFSDGCAPSASLLGPVLTGALASAGYAVVAPDYLGMNGLGAASAAPHPYLVGEATAIASLDAIRGARALLAGELAAAGAALPGVSLFGASQGGHAVLFTDLYAPYYAPEEEITGVAAAVPPADLVGEATGAVAAPIPATANILAVLAAFASWYGADLGEVLEPPFVTSVPAYVASACDLSGIDEGAAGVDDLFTPEFRAQAAAGLPADAGPWSCAFRANSLLTTPVERLRDTPTLFMLSELDRLVNSSLERGSFDALCATGLPLTYLECAGVGHTDGAVGSIAEQLAFLDARRRGEPLPEGGCTRRAPVTCSGTR